MDRRTFINTLGAALALPAVACAHPQTRAASAAAPRRLRRVGIQLYTLRTSAGQDLERTLADIAAAGYNDVEMLDSMRNFGKSPTEVRAMLDRNGLRAPSTHMNGSALTEIDRKLDDAAIIGHETLIVASLTRNRSKTPDDYRYWADEFNRVGQIARRRNIWIGFHNHPEDQAVVDGQVLYDTMMSRIDPSVVRMQLDIGNLAMAGGEPLAYMDKFGERYWSFHIKDLPAMGAKQDTELGKGVLDLRALLRRIDRIDEKHLYVEQESYPGLPLDSARRDYTYLSTLTF